MHRQSSKPWEDQEMLYKVQDTLSHIQFPYSAPAPPPPAVPGTQSGISCLNLYTSAPPAAAAPVPYIPGPPAEPESNYVDPFPTAQPAPVAAVEDEEDYEFVPVRQRRNKFNKADYTPQERKPIKAQRPPPVFAPSPTPVSVPKPATPVPVARPAAPAAAPPPFMPAEGEVVQPATPAWAGTLSNSGGAKLWDAGFKPSPINKPARSVSPQKKAVAAAPPGDFKPTQTQVLDFSTEADDGPRVIHLQYNSPLDMYSKANVEETLQGQTQAALGGGNTVQRRRKPQIASFLPSPTESVGPSLKQAPEVPPKRAPKPAAKPAPKPAAESGPAHEFPKASAVSVELALKPAIERQPKVTVRSVPKPVPESELKPINDSAPETPSPTIEFPKASTELVETAPEQVPEETSTGLVETAPEQVPEEASTGLVETAPEQVPEEASTGLVETAPEQVPEETSTELVETAPEQVPEEPPIKSKPISDTAPRRTRTRARANIAEPVQQVIISSAAEEPKVDDYKQQLLNAASSPEPLDVSVAPPKPSEFVSKTSEKPLPRSLSPTRTAPMKERTREGKGSKESKDSGLPRWLIPLSLFILLGAAVAAFFLYREHLQEKYPAFYDLIDSVVLSVRGREIEPSAQAGEFCAPEELSLPDVAEAASQVMESVPSAEELIPDVTETVETIFDQGEYVCTEEVITPGPGVEI